MRRRWGAGGDDSGEGRGLPRVPGSDRRQLIALVLLIAVVVATQAAFEIMGSWWTFIAGLLAAVVLLTVITAFDARERGWSTRHEFKEIVRVTRRR